MTEMTATLADRRRNTRINLELPVVLENATAVTRDLSPTGVFFWKRGVFAYGESIRFSIERTTDAGKVLQKCRGAVVRTEPRGYDVGVAVNFIESVMEPAPHQPGGSGPLMEAAPSEPKASAAAAEPVTDQSSGSAPATETAPSEPGGSTPAIEPVPGHSSAVAPSTEPVPDTPSGSLSAMEPGANQPGPSEPAIEPAPDKPSGRVRALEPVTDEPSVGASASEPVSGQTSAGAPVTPPGSSTDAPAQDIGVPASAIETIKRWSWFLRAKAFEARDELGGQEVLEWDIPLNAAPTSPRSQRVAVCSVTVDGLASNVSRVLTRNGMSGGSLRALERLLSKSRADASSNAGAPGIGAQSEFPSWSSPPDRCGVRIDLEIHIAQALADRGTPGKAPLQKIVIRMAPVPDGERPPELPDNSDVQKAYGDPAKAFEAFLALAVESAILMNLDSH